MDEKGNRWADSVLLNRQYEILSAEKREMLQTTWVPGNIEVRHSCASENIHQPSAIQTHGYLLVMDKDTYGITQVSANVTDLGYKYDDLFSKNLSDVVQVNLLEKIPPQVREFKPMVSFPVEFGVGDLKETFTAQFHVRGNWAFLEFERPIPQTASARLEANIPVLSFAQQLSSVADIAVGYQMLTDTVQEATQYDRVMVYKFHADWHGEVVAETLNKGVISFRGLHFPEYDVPRQARACFIRNVYGYTPEVKHGEVPLVPVECPIHQERPDMTLVSVRAKSPGSTQYYHNLGVCGILHYSILVDGKLWGLVACHHCTGPKAVPFDLRITVANAVEAFAVFVREKEEARVKWAARTSEPARQRIREMLEEGSGLRAALASPQSNLLDVLVCNGAAVAFGNKVHRFGMTPAPWQIQSLVEHVSLECGGWLCTADLSQVWEEARKFLEPQVGCLVQCNLVRSVADRVCLLWFRMPTNVEREWGGDPKSAYTAAGELQARLDFSPCLQAATIPAQPWTEAEQEVARALLRDIGVRDDEPERPGTEPRAESPRESTEKAEYVVHGQGGPAASPPVQPGSPTSPLSMQQSSRGTAEESVPGGGCWPCRKLFRKNDNTEAAASLIAVAPRSSNQR